jgi:hypothetical protein
MDNISKGGQQTLARQKNVQKKEFTAHQTGNFSIPDSKPFTLLNEFDRRAE